MPKARRGSGSAITGTKGMTNMPKARGGSAAPIVGAAQATTEPTAAQKVGFDKLSARAKRQFVEDHIVGSGADRLIMRKDGSFVTRHVFFYRFGGDSEKAAAGVERELGKAGLQVNVTNHFENWQPWPKDSYWQVEFTVREQ